MRYIVVAAVVTVGIVVQLSAQDAAVRDWRFDVASVKPSAPSQAVIPCQPPNCYMGSYETLPGRFRASRLSVLELVATAYEMPLDHVVGPEWTRSGERYSVNATHDPAATGRPALKAMLQHLLQDRFSLRLHREHRPKAVYVLKRARDDGKLGPQLVSISDCSARPSFLPSYYNGCGGMGSRATTSRVGRGKWEDLALHRHFAPSVDRPVIDETGLSGSFALLLDWSDIDTPSLLTAVREQLGLKLEAAERPVEVLVIDSVERPTPD